MLPVSGFMTEQIPVCSGLKICLIALSGLLSYGERNGTIRECAMYTADNPANPLIGVVQIFSALQYKSAKSQ